MNQMMRCSPHRRSQEEGGGARRRRSPRPPLSPPPPPPHPPPPDYSRTADDAHAPERLPADALFRPGAPGGTSGTGVCSIWTEALSAPRVTTAARCRRRTPLMNYVTRALAWFCEPSSRDASIMHGAGRGGGGEVRQRRHLHIGTRKKGGLGVLLGGWGRGSKHLRRLGGVRARLLGFNRVRRPGDKQTGRGGGRRR